MAKKNETVNTTQAVITRVFDAPVKLVWSAWTDPKHFMKWWGPKDFTSPAAKIDLRVGGKYVACMRSADGQEIWSIGTYKEIIQYKKLVYTDAFSDSEGNPVPASRYGLPEDFPEGTITVEFEDLGGKTKMTVTHAGLPLGEISEMTVVGWNESFDKLAASLN